MGLFSRKNHHEETAVPAASEAIPPEVIAVIAAAVACVLGSGARVVGVRRSTRSGAGKAAWRNAGIAENTRSF